MLQTEDCIRQFKSELPQFQEMTEKFYQKEVDLKTYKGFSGRYGSYAQRGGNANMLRLRLNSGRLTKDKFKFICDMIDMYQIDKIHVTTCQTIQLHNLAPQAVYGIMEKAIDHQIITWGGGGDFPRNVMTSPLSGVEQGEYFDVLPYAQAAADYLLTLINTIKMPRKLKVGFSNSPANSTHATFRDLGFVAREDQTFDVYSAGGLGANPKMGLLVASKVEPSKILYYIKAMTEVFMAHGNYENRAKARTRYMQDVLGKEGYIKTFQETLNRVMSSGVMMDIHPDAISFQKQGNGSTTSGPRILPQKQPGLYTVCYHPIGGTPSIPKMKELCHAILPMEDVELRLSPDESIYIINCNAAEANQLCELTDDGARNVFETSVACIGASICQVGMRDSQKLMHTLVEETRKYNFSDGVLPKIHISGCPSSCGTHQIGSLGFHGGIKLIEKQPKPAFTLHVNGCDLQGKERFGENWGVILEEDIPSFLIELGKQIQADGAVFETWLPTHIEDLKRIAASYIQK